MFLKYFPPLLVLCSTALITAQIIPTQPLFDCTNPNFQVIYTACSAGDYSQCCAVGSECCAGGCCTLLSFCVGVGTSKEACCAIGDPNFCGTGPSLPTPNVICEGGNGLSAYECPPGSTCNTYNDTCYLPSDQGSLSSADTPVLVTADASSIDAAPRTIVVPVSSNADTPEISATGAGGSASVAVVTPLSNADTPEISTTSAGGSASVAVVTILSNAATPEVSTTTAGRIPPVSVITFSASPAATSAKSSTASNLVADFFFTILMTSFILVAVRL